MRGGADSRIAGSFAAGIDGGSSEIEIPIMQGTPSVDKWIITGRSITLFVLRGTVGIRGIGVRTNRLLPGTVGRNRTNG